MKVLEVNTFDSGGGAARAMMRLLHALREQGIDASLICKSKRSGDPHVYGPDGFWANGVSKLRGTIDRLPLRKYPKRNHAFSANWLADGVNRQIERIAPDVVHLGWLQAGFMQIESLPRIRRPVVWTTHDMWMFTGGCHYAMGFCRRFEENCGKCPVLGSEVDDDLSRRVYLRKMKAWKEWDFIPVAMTRWLAEMTMKSTLFAGRDVRVIPWPLNMETFSPMSKAEARKQLDLPQDSDVILFGAVEATSDPNKGYDLLLDALSELKAMNPKKPVQLVVFGSSGNGGQCDLPFPTRFLGKLSDDAALRAAYCAADVMTVPSRQEAFGQTATEALACGTPVVAFGATGLLDTVVHRECGYLARPYEAKDLAFGLMQILQSKEGVGALASWECLSQAARKRALENWTNKRIADLYIETYQATIERHRQKNFEAAKSNH